jgi:hypothetical protein
MEANYEKLNIWNHLYFLISTIEIIDQASQGWNNQNSYVLHNNLNKS